MNSRRLAFLLAAFIFSALVESVPVLAQPASIPVELRERAQSAGRVRAIVELRTGRAQVAEGRMSRAAAAAQRRRIRNAGDAVTARMQARNARLMRRFESVPFVVLEVDTNALDALASDPDVVAVVEDRLLEPSLAESIPLVEADAAHGLGLDGSGTVVAILDTGVDASHPFLAGKVVAEACFASPGQAEDPGDCPNGTDTQTGTGAGVPCSYVGCDHGTHVAGIAAGQDASVTGVAPGADLIAVQVFHASNFCAVPPCPLAYGSDISAGLEYVYDLRDQYDIAAVNMSLGGGISSSSCDGLDPQMTAVIDNLRSVEIATVVASGNDGVIGGLGFPACISSAISVAATDDSDLVAWFSNTSSDLDLFAPGVAIDSSVPGGQFANFNGTSMASPHVAGAFAILRQANSSASVDELLTTLSDTGRPVYDDRGGATPVVKSRIRLSGAVGISSPTPTLASVSPNTLDAWGASQTVSVTGSGFIQATYALVSGVIRPTTFVSDTELLVSVLDTDLGTGAGSLGISVANPPPGGGSSAELAIALRAPVFTFSSATAETGEVINVSWSQGPTGVGSWVALAQVGAPDSSYADFRYMTQLPVANSWDVTMPFAGDFEIRLYPSFAYERVATSQALSVSDSIPDPGNAELTVSATAVAGGDPITASLTGSSGVAGDWLAFAEVGAPESSYLQWTYVGSGNTSLDWTITAPLVPGQYEFRLFTDSSYTLLVTSEAVTVLPPPPADVDLTVSATDVAPGEQLTVSVTGAPGGGGDWLSLAGVGTPDSSFLQWTYLGSGTTSFDWTVTMPTTPGEYEFRFYENNGYVVLTRSAVVTVVDPGPGPGAPELTVDATAVVPGDPITVTLVGGSGNTTDWLAFAAVGTPGTSYLSYTYVGAGVTSRSWTVTAPSTGGDYEFRFMPDNGYTAAATSPPVSVVVAEPDPPSLTVEVSSASPGEAVTVTLANGYGGTGDWLGLAAVGAPDTSYLQWNYVGDGVTDRTWTVNMPSASGDYEFRLFRDYGYTRAATSTAVTVP